MEIGVTTGEFKPSQNLSEARNKIRQLPGMENYLSSDEISSVEVEKGIDKAVSELNQQLDAQGSVIFIKNALGFTDQESEEFFNHPDRQPYKSKLQLSEDKGVFKNQLQVVGAYLRLRYEQTRSQQGIDSGELEKRAEILKFFYEASLLFLFSDEENSVEDEISGVANRQTGARVSDEMQNLFRQTSDKVGKVQGVKPDKLHSQVLAATGGGNFAMTFTFLTNYQGKPEVREVLQETIETRRNDRDLAKAKLKLLWRTEVYRLSMGLDLDTLYEINHLPDGKIIEKMMHEFLQDEINVSEMYEHLERETPNVLSQAKESKEPIDFWRMLAERAKYHNFAQNVESTDELEAKKKKVWEEISQYLPPLAFEDVSTSYIDTPTRLGSETRGYNVTYTNADGRLVNVSLVNPRDEESLFASKFGHELGHKLHARVLMVAEGAHHVSAQSWDNLVSSVKEEFSQAVEDQVAKMQKRKRVDVSGVEKKVQEGQWRDLWTAYLIRKQGAYALIQRDVRLRIQRLWDEGKRDELTDSEADKIIDEIEPKAQGYYSEGVGITSPSQTLSNNIKADAPLDGLVYLLDHIKKSEAKSNQQNEVYIGIKQAFASRFGEIWIDNPDARAVLLALMGESGRNQEVDTYAKYIKETGVDEAMDRLESWGISKEEI